MIPTDDIKAQYDLLHHGSKDEQIAKLKDKLMFWRVVGATLGLMFIVATLRALSK